jgi:acetylglutamate kinase
MRGIEPERSAAPEGVVQELLDRAGNPAAGVDRLRGLRDAVVVVKYGGAAMVSTDAAVSFARDVVLLHRAGSRPLVVHGGGPALTRTMERLGIESTFLEGHRVTDSDAAEVAEMVLSGRVNKQVVSLIQRAGGRAVGLSGTDGGMVRVERHRPSGADIGFVGLVEEVDPALLDLLQRHGYIPVVSSTAADDEGQSHNINADVMAGALAGGVSAEELVFLSDVAGVLVDGEIRPVLSAGEAAHVLEAGAATGGMRPKLEGALTALAAGVPRVHLVDGRRRHALPTELLSEKGIGTLVLPDDTPASRGGAP